jgi:hypothetical protein
MRSYFIILAAAAAITVFTTSFAGWILDPYAISHALAGKVWWGVNERASKIGFLAKHCRQFSSYIVGNSRAMILSGEELAGGAGDQYYNLGISSDDIGHSLTRLEFLFRSGCPITRLLVAESIDFFARGNPDSLWQIEHPLVSGSSALVFYGKYFLGPQGMLAYLRARARVDSSERAAFYYSDGHADYLWEMKNDADFSIPFCKTSRLSAESKEALFERLPQYRRLAALANEHHAKVVVWLTPLSKARSTTLDDPDVDRYIAELRRIPGLAVFEADRNSPLLSDFHQWHDCSHFHRAIFDQLVAPGVAGLLRQ